MAKNKENKDEELFNAVLEGVENGKSLRDACTSTGLGKTKFYELLKEDQDKSETDRRNYADKYARACEERADAEFEQIIKIADGEDVEDTKDRVARDRLRIDARKWRLSKMQPKKYGDKLEVDLNTEIEPIQVEFVMPNPRIEK